MSSGWGGLVPKIHGNFAHTRECAHACECHSGRAYCQIGQMNITVASMNTYGERIEAALAAQIKVELAERGMEQRGLADALGIESATLSRYMTGKRSMPMPTFVKVAETFNLSPYELMKRAEARIAAEGPTGERLA